MPRFPGLAADTETSAVRAGYIDHNGMFGLGLTPPERGSRRGGRLDAAWLKHVNPNIPALTVKFLSVNKRTAKVVKFTMRDRKRAPVFQLRGGPGGIYDGLASAEEAFTAWAQIQPDPFAVTALPVTQAPALPTVVDTPLTLTTPVAALPVPAVPALSRPTAVPETATTFGAGWIWSGYDGFTPTIKAYLNGTTQAFGFGPNSWERAQNWIAKGGIEGLSGLGGYRSSRARRSSIWA